MKENSWIEVPDDNSSSRAYSNIIDRYLWRDLEDKTELIVVFDEENHKARYKYFEVTEEDFKELWLRTTSPNKYDKPIDKWFLRNISESYEYQTFKDFKANQ